MAGTEPPAWGTGLMDDAIFVRLDMHKATVCVATAESGRGREIRQVGVFENRPEILVQDGSLARARRPSDQLLL
jgi:hypothetical protein